MAARATAEAENARHTRYKRCAGFRPGRVGSRSCKSVRTRPRISAARSRRAASAPLSARGEPAEVDARFQAASPQPQPARAQGDNDGRPASEIERLVDVSDTAVCSEHPPAPTQVVPERGMPVTSIGRTPGRARSKRLYPAGSGCSSGAQLGEGGALARGGHRHRPTQSPKRWRRSTIAGAAYWSVRTAEGEPRRTGGGCGFPPALQSGMADSRLPRTGIAHTYCQFIG
jgi:hypothetical protein